MALLCFRGGLEWAFGVCQFENEWLDGSKGNCGVVVDHQAYDRKGQQTSTFAGLKCWGDVTFPSCPSTPPQS